jgi:uncharacterized membrane protein YgcG
MQSKTLVLALSVAAFSSCSTAYKTGQTPDDVYYSPVKVVEVTQNNERDEDRYKPADDYEITMGIRDPRWRDFNDDYQYNSSPYYYATCNTYNYGYYYNPYYYPWAIYTGKPVYSAPVNTTPRMVNLKAYNGYSARVATGKTTGSVTWASPTSKYNNSNRSGSRLGNLLRQTIEPSNSSPLNNTRSYSPSSGSSGGSSSGSGGGSGSVSRPGRGG